MSKGPQEALVTKNFFPGESVYNEKRISVEENGEKTEYRVWNPYRSKIAAAIIGGISDTYIRPGSKVLYLGKHLGSKYLYFKITSFSRWCFWYNCISCC